VSPIISSGDPYYFHYAPYFCSIIAMTLYHELYDAKYRSAIAKGWSGWGSVDREELGYILFERIRSNVHIPTSGRGLELGCGEGQLSRKLLKVGYDMTGVDISKVAIAWAKSKDPEGAVCYLHRDLTKENAVCYGRYNLVIDGNCLHCIPPEGRANFYGNVRGALHEQGIFYVSTRCSKQEPKCIEEAGLLYRYFTSVSMVEAELEYYGFNILSKDEYDRGNQVHLDIAARVG
jgi:SAM-dependent methyltransferase